jgi:hypothetical protein
VSDPSPQQEAERKFAHGVEQAEASARRVAEDADWLRTAAEHMNKVLKFLEREAEKWPS